MLETVRVGPCCRCTCCKFWIEKFDDVFNPIDSEDDALLPPAPHTAIDIDVGRQNDEPNIKTK